MKKSLITLTCVLLGLFSNTTNAQVISVGSGTDFSIGSGTLVSADSLDITPSANFILNGCSMVRSVVANNSTTIPYIKKVYQFSNTTNAFSGALKMFYSNASLNGLTESGLKLLIHNGTSWSLDNNSSVNTTNKFVQNSAVNGVTLKELTAATCTPTSSIDTKTACSSYIWHGTTYTASNNTATWTGTNAAGCDSVVTLNLTITPLPATPIVNVVNNCNGTSTLSTTASGTLLWSTGATSSSIIVSNAGTYTVTQTVNGCASEAGSGTAAPKTTPATPIVTVVNNCNGTSTLSTIPSGPGSSLLWNIESTSYSLTVSSAGTYSVRQMVNGCISESGFGTAAPKTTPATPIVNVVNNCNGTSTLSTTASGTLLWSTGATTSFIIVSTAATYTVTQTVDGCTSAAGSGTAAPKATPATPIVNVVNNCNGSTALSTTATGTLLWSTGANTSSIIVSTAGTYTVTQTVDGCTSVAGSGRAAPKTVPATPTVNVVNNCNGTSTLSTTATGTLLWSTGATTSSIIVGSAGTYTVRQSVDGCASEAGSGVAAAPQTSNTSTTTLTACDSYTWPVNGQTYSISGTYTSVSGCATRILNLTITASTTNTTTEKACDNFTWSVDGQTYTSSGTYSFTLGCVTNILNLTIAESTSSITRVSACDSFIWHDNTYTSSITDTWTGVNSAGCDSNATLILTITPSTSNTSSVSRCDSYTWPVNGQSYTTSGTYSSVSGCHTVFLSLTITPSTIDTKTVNECDTYTWSVDGQTYFSSGTYSFTLECVTYILNLTITESSSSTTTVSACGSYTWSVDGQTYTSSGSYTSEIACTTKILNLTILPSPNVTITSNPSTVCAGTAVTFTATPTNGGTNPIYQWKLNGNNVGTNSTTYTNSNLTSTDVVTVEMTASNATDDVTIGSQVWTSKNLEVTTYRNGDPITKVTNATQWLGMTTGAYCYLNYDSVNNSKYGKLYNWYAVNDSRGLAPLGYHIPTTNEIDIFTSSVNYNAKSIMSTTGWVDFSGNDASGTNTTGFNALPSGGHGNGGTGYFVNMMAIFWTSQESGNNARFYGCFSWDPYISSGGEEKRNGYPVRLISEGTSVVSNNICTAPVTSNAISVSVTPSITTDTTTETACDSYTWSVNGETYTTSGTYTSVSGCNTELLNLTIATSTSNVSAVSACDSYTWSVNNVTYTNSGSYTYSYTNSSGCSVIETLYLTIKQSVTPSVSISSNATNNSINCGSSVTFTATPTNGGINPIYQWKLNGNNVVGANNAMYINNNLSDSDVVSVVMTVNNNLTVNIGNQTWMNKNLDVSTYNNGDVIPQITDSISWTNATYGAWCYYNNDSATYAAKYGKLYNWYAINDSRGLAPVGYHIPSLEEWQTLNTTLGGGLGAGNALKSSSDWLTYNGSNASGFNAYPGGVRLSSSFTVANFIEIGNVAAWWTTNLYNDSLPLICGILDGLVFDNANKSFGLSVRCIKNEYSSAPVIITVNNTPTVNIRAQTWMNKNLDVSTYNNGDVIPQITDSVSWTNATYGAWCYYNNDSATYAAKYGKLYNWYAINDSRGLAPVGYHIPSLEEWQTMNSSLGGGLGAGNALKSTSDWLTYNGSNASGFNAYPGGVRLSSSFTVANFIEIGNVAAWWTTNLYNDSLPLICGILDGLVFDSANKSFGLSVRCIKNEYDATNDVFNCYTTNTASSNTISTTVIYNHDTTTASTCESYIWSVNGETYTTSGIYTSVSGCNTEILNLTITPCTTTLNITALLEGFLIGDGTMRASIYDLGISTIDNETDTLEVNLWSEANLTSTTPNYSVKAVLHTDGTLTASFPGATLNNSYYLALKHRNHLETWSASPIMFGSTNNIDFSSSMSAVFTDGFNDPLKSVSSGKYALYAGDVNQDGTVDLFDAQITENGAANFLFGYDASDCNGDGSTDLFDLQLIDNNSTLFLFYSRPY